MLKSLLLPSLVFFAAEAASGAASPSASDTGTAAPTTYAADDFTPAAVAWREKQYAIAQEREQALLKEQQQKQQQQHQTSAASATPATPAKQPTASATPAPAAATAKPAAKPAVVGGSTNSEPDAGGSTATSKGEPHGVKPDASKEEAQKKADDLTPAPTEFDHLKSRLSK